MADVKAAWNDAGDKLSGLGSKLKAHYEQQHGTDSEQAQAEVRDAVKRLTEAVHDAFDAIGAAAKDQAVKDDVKQVGQAFGTAVGATFTEISEDLQKAYAKVKASRASGGAQTDGQTSPPAAEPPKIEASGDGERSQDSPQDPSTEPKTEPKTEPWGTP